MGTDKFLKEMWPKIKAVAVEPAESAVMSQEENLVYMVFKELVMVVNF